MGDTSAERPKSAYCDEQFKGTGARLLTLELIQKEHHKDLEGIAAELHRNNDLLNELVRRTEFKEAMRDINGKLVLYVPKIRYQLIEAAVIAWNAAAVFVLAGYAFKMIGVK